MFKKRKRRTACVRRVDEDEDAGAGTAVVVGEVLGELLGMLAFFALVAIIFLLLIAAGG